VSPNHPTPSTKYLDTTTLTWATSHTKVPLSLSLSPSPSHSREPHLSSNPHPPGRRLVEGEATKAPEPTLLVWDGERVVRQKALSGALLYFLGLGDNHTVLVSEEGEPYVMGKASAGRLGTGDTTKDLPSPTRLYLSYVVRERARELESSMEGSEEIIS